MVPDFRTRRFLGVETVAIQAILTAANVGWERIDESDEAGKKGGSAQEILTCIIHRRGHVSRVRGNRRPEDLR